MSLTLNTNINSLNAQCSLTNSQATLSQVLQRLSSGLRINSAAGGALSTLTGNLQSIRTLAVESANGSNSASDRAALDQQVQQQIAEITRIASQTQFNGLNVLDGSSGVTTYQVGAN
ncbi:MAG: flagellin, partial [Gammaproteobacteria bacterium]